MPRTESEHHVRLVELARKRKLPDPPARPVPGECCELGCDPCIWHYYERALERWVQRHRAKEGRWS